MSPPPPPALKFENCELNRLSWLGIISQILMLWSMFRVVRFDWFRFRSMCYCLKLYIFYWLGPRKSGASGEWVNLKEPDLFFGQKCILQLFSPIELISDFPSPSSTSPIFLLFLGPATANLSDFPPSQLPPTLQLFDRYKILSTRQLQSILLRLLCRHVHSAKMRFMSARERVFRDFSGLNFLLQRCLKFGTWFWMALSSQGEGVSLRKFFTQYAFISIYNKTF